MQSENLFAQLKMMLAALKGIDLEYILSRVKSFGTVFTCSCVLIPLQLARSSTSDSAQVILTQHLTDILALQVVITGICQLPGILSSCSSNLLVTIYNVCMTSPFDFN
jgi:hypothetical protein